MDKPEDARPEEDGFEVVLVGLGSMPIVDQGEACARKAALRGFVAAVWEEEVVFNVLVVVEEIDWLLFMVDVEEDV